jgi:hypothetical protein
MYNVSVKWKDGTVTHDVFNDPYMIVKHYTKEEIKALYNGNPNIDYINIVFESVRH